jgi:hypothetical protein
MTPGRQEELADEVVRGVHIGVQASVRLYITSGDRRGGERRVVQYSAKVRRIDELTWREKPRLETCQFEGVLVRRRRKNILDNAVENMVVVLDPDSLQLLVCACETCCGLGRRAREDKDD